MDDAERGVTIGYGLDEHAYRQKVIYLVDALPFGCVFLHLVMDAIYVLCPPLNLSLNAVLLQLFADDIGHLCDIRLSHLALGVDEVGNELVLVRLQVSEGQVLELPFDVPDAQSGRQRSVYLYGLSGDAPLIFWF